MRTHHRQVLWALPILRRLWHEVEEVYKPRVVSAGTPVRGLSGQSKPVRLDEISGDAEERIALDIGEFARVLGGGIVPGSIVLVGGDPGIGKSTLLLQMSIELSASRKVLYVSGEDPSGRSKCAPCACCVRKGTQIPGESVAGHRDEHGHNSDAHC